jgi:hypothetical protein
MRYRVKGSNDSMTDISKQPPEDVRQYEDVDDALDEQDATGEGSYQRDIEDMTVDRVAAEEAGADLEDADQISLLEDGVDDPDGSGPRGGPDEIEAGWDVETLTTVRGADEQVEIGAEGDAVTEDELIFGSEIDDPDLEEIDTDPADLEQIADPPGPESSPFQ